MSSTSESRSGVLTASGAASTYDGNYVGYVISVITAAATIFIRDGADNTGAIVDAIPAGTAVGAVRNHATPIRIKKGIFVDFNGGTGSLTVFYN